MNTILASIFLNGPERNRSINPRGPVTKPKINKHFTSRVVYDSFFDNSNCIHQQILALSATRNRAPSSRTLTCIDYALLFPRKWFCNPSNSTLKVALLKFSTSFCCRRRHNILRSRVLRTAGVLSTKCR